MRQLLTLVLLSFFMGAACNKEKLPEFYFTCKVDGKEYVPDNCANCRTAKVLRDTVFLINGNRGFETVRIGLNDKDGVQQKTYVLNGSFSGSAAYDNSPSVLDIFKTDSVRTGVLNITSVDKAQKTISGTFSFDAYNAVQNKTVKVTEGKFRLKYDTN
ncbi:hypothetical protein HRH25_23195 [Flavisolibacter sp. BT320]|nr:hypothetical protein [Flavisolibacter longurius]